jgi:predicted amidophosphoribosyltransferase
MPVEDTIGYVDASNVCDVCGKDLGACGAFARVQHRGRPVAVCCPMCLAAFQQDPAPYVARLEKIERYRALKKLAQPSQPES